MSTSSTPLQNRVTSPTHQHTPIDQSSVWVDGIVGAQTHTRALAPAEKPRGEHGGLH